MSASEHLQPYQMRLFYTARELVEGYPSGDAGGSSLSENPDVLEEKLTESKTGAYYDARTEKGKDESLYDSVKRQGLYSPVMMVHPSERLQKVMGPTIHPSRRHMPVIADSNHRLAALYDINPDAYVIPDYRN